MRHPGATVLLNAPCPAGEVFDRLPREVQEEILAKKLKVFAIDAYAVARESGMGGRINSVMQTCFFALSGVLPREEAIAKIKGAIEKTYGKKGQEVVRRNFEAVDQTLKHLHEVEVPKGPTAATRRPPIVPKEAPDFVQRVTATLLAGKGDLLPVSAFPVDGTWPTATARWEKRAIALEIPVWDEPLCIQCNKCALVCPHAAIRAKVYEPAAPRLGPRPPSRPWTTRATNGRARSTRSRWRPRTALAATSAWRCARPRTRRIPRRKAINMTPVEPLRATERENYAFFLDLPEPDRTKVKVEVLKQTQFLEPLFEYSGACAGCGETPYLKLLSQLFGDRTIVANATGCSSIYGGNLPTTPWSVDANGRGPAWSNSLFEDNAEFGLGLRLGVDALVGQARDLVRVLAPRLGDVLVRAPCSRPTSPRRPGSWRSAEGSAPSRQALAGMPGAEAARLHPPRGLPGEEERLDRGR